MAVSKVMAHKDHVRKYLSFNLWTCCQWAGLRAKHTVNVSLSPHTILISMQVLRTLVRSSITWLPSIYNLFYIPFIHWRSSCWLVSIFQLLVSMFCFRISKIHCLSRSCSNSSQPTRQSVLSNCQVYTCHAVSCQLARDLILLIRHAVNWKLLRTACTHAHNFLVWGWKQLLVSNGT